MYLLDTNICIFAINKRPLHVIEIIKDKLKSGIYISSLTVAELEYGVENSQYIEDNRIALLKFLSIFNIINFDDMDAEPYGKLKTRLKKTGKIIGPIDMLLAAQAISKHLILVTNNVDEFTRIEGLTIEDWSK
ncbi:MAG: twitching motility protein PilT [Spirochaetes bacterium GWF1_31_7]|nr:MAG: twitching motility protein PilT [Spirochaetes bacterium GWE1_32_154]OHD45651.1 MAG: twitching motility protein PilT [Spirochaetes bacterium GWE2_31_10]OHD48222.1 MAG: twitching motility protein PilT [Spirochaetes bacterium GWF1_31_7]HBD95789.1 VapC toxin family PIN domain ribonuclease [Spirochaetia bacterium]HBI37594.1 VapC toxin family PIN domain ribonuclease [Spirochaetia bacterium]